MRDFKKFEIWQKGMEIAKAIYSLLLNMPTNEKYGITSQILRAAVSIPSNIAEGAGRSSDLEFKRFMEISLGSSYELETQLILIQEVGLLLENKELIRIRLLVIEEQKMLNGFIAKIKSERQ